MTDQFKLTVKQMREFKINDNDRLIIDGMDVRHVMKSASVLSANQSYLIRAEVSTHIGELWKRAMSKKSFVAEMYSKALQFGVIGSFQIEQHDVFVEDGEARSSIDLVSVIPPITMIVETNQ